MRAFEKHKNDYFKTMINAWLVLSKKHNKKIEKVNKDVFYWSSFVDVELEFTNKGKLLNYKFITNYFNKTLEQVKRDILDF